MKRLLIACALLATFGVNASNVGINNYDAMRGVVNLECTSSNGDVLEVDGTLFPQQVEIQSTFFSLQNVKKQDGSKYYFYVGHGETSSHFAIGQLGKATVIRDFTTNTTYGCN